MRVYRRITAALALALVLFSAVLTTPTATQAAGTPPLIYGISPNSGPIFSQTQVMIYGNNFKPGSQVFVGGQKAMNEEAAECYDIGGGRLNCAVLYATFPPGRFFGTVSVTVVNPNGQRGTLFYGFTYY